MYESHKAIKWIQYQKCKDFKDKLLRCSSYDVLRPESSICLRQWTPVFVIRELHMLSQSLSAERAFCYCCVLIFEVLQSWCDQKDEGRSFQREGEDSSVSLRLLARLQTHLSWPHGFWPHTLPVSALFLLLEHFPPSSPGIFCSMGMSFGIISPLFYLFCYVCFSCFTWKPNTFLPLLSFLHLSHRNSRECLGFSHQVWGLARATEAAGSMGTNVGVQFNVLQSVCGKPGKTKRTIWCNKENICDLERFLLFFAECFYKLPVLFILL